MVEVKLFGAIEIFCDGVRLTDFRSQKTLVLLAFLICENRPITRDYLASLFWPEVDQSSALGHLRRALYDLGKKLPDVLTVNRRTAAFTPADDVRVDTLQFTQLVASNQQEAALALTQAPFLEGVYLADCAEAETWISGQQEYWRQQVAALLEQVTAERQAQGAFEDALVAARQWARWAPWRETAHRAVMTLLARTGQRRAIDAQYQLCEHALRDELGIDVSAETTALYHRLQHLPQPRHNLPPDQTPFIGRSAEITELNQLLLEPHTRLITLVGMGGIGKTRLARAVAHVAHARFLDGVWHISLAGVQAADQLHGRIATTLGLQLSARQPLPDQIAAYLHQREMLLLLDNFEQLVADSAEWLATLLTAAPQLKIVVTSRQPLQLTEEWLFTVAGLPFAADDDQPIDSYPATQLFVSAARRLQHSFDAASEQRAVADICRIVRGVPLALELAAASIRARPCAAIAQAIAADLHTLADPRRNVPARHRTMLAVFNQSWQLLDAAEQLALMQLSVFRGGFSAAAAHAIAQIDTTVLTQLIDHSLVAPADNERYELHELIRQFAFAKLTDEPSFASTIQTRHAEQFLNWLVQKDIQGDEGVSEMAAIASDMANISMAWQWAVQTSEWQLLAKTTDAIMLYFVIIGDPRGAIPYFAQALANDNCPQPVRDEMEGAVAYMQGWAGEFTSGIATVASMLARTLSPSAELKALLTKAMIATEQGHFNDVIAVATIGLQKSIDANALQWQQQFIMTIARGHMGNYALQQAVDYLEQARILAEQSGNRRVETTILANLGFVAMQQGLHLRAVEIFSRAEENIEKYNHEFARQMVLLNLAAIKLQQGDAIEAVPYLERAITYCRRHRNLRGLPHVLSSIASAHMQLGQFDEVPSVLTEAIAISDQIAAQGLALYLHIQFGAYYSQIGRFKLAHRQFDAAMALSRQLDNKEDLLTLQCHQMRLAWLEGDETRLLQLHEIFNTVTLAEAIAFNRPTIALLQSRYAEHHNHLEKARVMAEEALKWAQSGLPREIPLCYVQLGYVALAGEAWKSAETHFTTALAHYVDRNLPHLAAEPHVALAYLAHQRGDYATAQKHRAAVQPHLTGRYPLAGTQRPDQIKRWVSMFKSADSIPKSIPPS